MEENSTGKLQMYYSNFKCTQKIMKTKKSACQALIMRKYSNAKAGDKNSQQLMGKSTNTPPSNHKSDLVGKARIIPKP